MSPTIVAEIFGARQNNLNLRHTSFSSMPYVKTVNHGSESLSNLGPRIWNLIPRTLKELNDVNSFKTLKNGNLKTVYIGYVKRIYLMLDLYNYLYFLTILLNLIILLLFVVVR